MAVFTCNHGSYGSIQVQPWHIQVQSVKCSRGSIQVQSVTSAAMAAFKCNHGSIQVRSHGSIQAQS